MAVFGLCKFLIGFSTPIKSDLIAIESSYSETLGFPVYLANAY
jgi:hypothetical protein